MKNITLIVDRLRITIPERKLEAIVEEYLSKSTIAPIPMEGKWFEVKPLSIDQKLFEKARKDEKQERTRLIILEAFEEMSKYPEKYARNFKTLVPKRERSYISVDEVKEMACQLGDHNADWVEQALEWAQRIDNGESWKSICNDPDLLISYYRLVVWKTGNIKLVGGAVNCCHHYPATDIGADNWSSYDEGDFLYTVPLVVSYEE